MCGIVGLLSPFEPDTELGIGMLSQITRRGPDSGHLYKGKNILLGLRRLAIVGIENGVQPAFSEDKKIAIVFNGEIYNHREIKAELQKKGYKIRDGSDVEIIPHAYEEWGLDFVSHFNGDFAIALWDERKQELILARDRMGIKPLFYAMTTKGEFSFASEIKALFAHPDISRKLNFNTLAQIFTFWTPVDSYSAFDGIAQVQSGTVLRFSATGKPLESYRFWEVPFLRDKKDLISTNFNECKELFKNELLKSVKLRLQADVEVGTYTSGGIDSAVIAQLAYKELSHKNTQTFSVTFDDPLLDETHFQRLVTDSLDIKYNPVLVTNDLIYRNFQRTIQFTEAPIFRTAPVPMGLLSARVREKGIKVILTGEGSDEVIWGYDIYRETRVRRFWSRFPNSEVRPQLFRRMYHYLPQFQNKRFFNLTVDFFKSNLTELSDPLYSHILRILNSTSTHVYLSENFKAKMNLEHPLETLKKSVPSDYSERSALEKCQYLEMKTLLNGYLLSSQGDRMLSSNSVEGRFPYLDHHFVEFMAKVPHQFKLCGLKDKHILRETFKGKLPNDIVYRPKHAYRAPEMAAFVGDSDGYVEKMLSANFIEEVGVFDPGAVAVLYEKLKSAKPDKFSTRDNLAFLQILSTQVLYSHFIHNFEPEFLRRDDVTVVFDSHTSESIGE